MTHAPNEDRHASGDNEVELARVAHRYDLAKNLGRSVFVASFALPIYVALPLFEDLAGKDTNVEVTISITAAISIALGGTVLALWRKNRSQGKELERLRRRCAELEAGMGVT